jgi:hypothetical protein
MLNALCFDVNRLLEFDLNSVFILLRLIDSCYERSMRSDGNISLLHLQR